MRGGTRIPCEISTTLTSLNPDRPFTEPCLVILVNPQGCAIRSGRPVELGAIVRLDGLPTKKGVIARVVNCISLRDYAKSWLLALTLTEPGNVWGVQSPPEDWK